MHASRLYSLLSLLLVSLSLMAQDPWVVETSSPLANPYFGITTANGQIGLLSSREPMCVDKVIVGGLYDVCGKGRVDNYFPNINPLTVVLKIDNQPITLENILDYTQSFDFRNATFHGRFMVEGKAQVDYTIVALRQMPFGYMMDVKVQANSPIMLDVANTHSLPGSLHGMQTNFRKVVNRARSGAEKQINYVQMTTTAKSPTDRWNVAANTAFVFPDVKNGGIEVEITHSIDSAHNSQAQRFTQQVAAGQTMHFAVVGTEMGSNVAKDVTNEVERLTLFLLMEGYDRLWQRHNEAWNELWKSDVVVDGPQQDQQDIHNMLYHLYAFNREGSGLSCPPMGLSGQGYHGHLFWDSETWMFPALLVMQPQIAKEMLNYRFNRLDAARRNAYNHGYIGAWFPWESAYTGEEETPSHNLYPGAEIHLTADVAIACWQYYCVTGDKQWLKEKGWSVLKATAEFWVSRVEWDNEGRANLNNVIGADEWTCNPMGGKQVNNNAYTNAAAKANLMDAIKAAKIVGEPAPKAWQQTADGLRFDYLDNGVTAEHSTYDGHAIKQADVILLAYPLKQVTDKEQMRRDLEYYLTKTPDKKTPAMSKSIYSILYNRLGESDKALYYFRDSYLPNLNPPFRVMAEFNGGTNPYFMTGAGGTLQSLLFGFAGLDITDKGLIKHYKTALPKDWRSLTIRRAGQKDFRIYRH